MLGLSHVQKSPNWSFAGKAAPDADRDVPGPGTYQVSSAQQGSRFQKGSHYSFGSSGREVLTRTKIPGPGTYTLPSDIGKAGGFSMPARKKDKPASCKDYPGPGNYSIPVRLGEGPKFSASAKQKEQKTSTQPGPGDYDSVPGETTGDRQPRCCFGTATTANAASASNDRPGPGAYEPGHYAETPRFTMKARPRQPKIEETPGPGSHGGHFSSLGDYRPARPRSSGVTPRGGAGGAGGAGRTVMSTPP